MLVHYIPEPTLIIKYLLSSSSCNDVEPQTQRDHVLNIIVSPQGISFSL